MKWPQLPSKLSPYCLKFTQHVAQFIQKQSPLGKWQQHSWSLAVSGGIDSVSLAYALAIIAKRKLLAAHQIPNQLIHINHKSRATHEHERESKSLGELSHILGLKFISYEAPQTTIGASELVWRDLRKFFFQEHAKQYSQYILQAHHLDDSWEWALLQSMKSSNPKHSLGIPFRHGPFMRPFLCVTKKQITKFASQLNIPHFRDETSADLRLERNFLRLQITPTLQKRYPSYLKFYAFQSQQKAHEYHLAWREVDEGKWFFESQNSKFFLWTPDKRKKDLLLPLNEMRLAIEYLSNSHRGKHAAQLQQLQQTWINHRKGPVDFSGDVQVKILKDFQILFYRRGFIWNDSIALFSFKKWSELFLGNRETN
jgi:tRNA(Ile)-lysidine synthase